MLIKKFMQSLHPDRAERHDLKSRLLLFILLFFFHLFLLEGRERGEKNTQSRDLEQILNYHDHAVI